MSSGIINRPETLGFLQTEFPHIDAVSVEAVQTADREGQADLPVLVHIELSDAAGEVLTTVSHTAPVVDMEQTQETLDLLIDEVGTEFNTQISYLGQALLAAAILMEQAGQPKARRLIELYVSVLRRIRPNAKILATRFVKTDEQLIYPEDRSTLLLIERTGLSATPTKH